MFLDRQGDVESAMKYLEMFVELADRSQQLPEQQKACTCLGAIYNSLVRHYEIFVKWFARTQHMIVKDETKQYMNGQNKLLLAMFKRFFV